MARGRRRRRHGARSSSDKSLSDRANNNCQSCHYRELGWTAANVLSHCDNADLNTRCTQSLYNRCHQSIWYQGGCAATMEAQTLVAWRNQISIDPAVAAAGINAVPAHPSQFQAVYGAPASPDSIVKLLTAYLRTQTSENSPWDRDELCDVKAVTTDAVEGWQRFSGKGGGTGCHAPPFFGNSTLFNIGLAHRKDKLQATNGVVPAARWPQGG